MDWTFLGWGYGYIIGSDKLFIDLYSFGKMKKT